MNILPHKSWHVRTKANIARVRKDEAKAAEEEKERIRRVELAESETRKNLLREKAKLKFNNNIKKKIDGDELKQHVNLFKEVEGGTDGYKKTNDEHEKEEKEKIEKYEKSIGYLTYLGQNTQVRKWYETKRLRDELTEETTKNNSKQNDIQEKQKHHYDPLNIMNKYVKIYKFDKNESTNQSKEKNTKINEQDKPIDCEMKNLNDKSSKNLKRKQDISSSSETSMNYIQEMNSSIRSRSKIKKDSGRYSSKHKIRSGARGKKLSKKRKREKYLKSYSLSSSSSDLDISKNREKRKVKRNKKHKNDKSYSYKRKSIESNYTPFCSSESKEKKLIQLREERLKREIEEKRRAEKYLAKLKGDNNDEINNNNTTVPEFSCKQKYNSQYNPEIAKRNKSPP